MCTWWGALDRCHWSWVSLGAQDGIWGEGTVSTASASPHTSHRTCVVSPMVLRALFEQVRGPGVGGRCGGSINSGRAMWYLEYHVSSLVGRAVACGCTTRGGMVGRCACEVPRYVQHQSCGLQRCCCQCLDMACRLGRVALHDGESDERSTKEFGGETAVRSVGERNKGWRRGGFGIKSIPVGCM
jgi:hypothetical protein